MEDWKKFEKALVADGWIIDEGDYAEKDYVWTTETTDDMKKNAASWDDIYRDCVSVGDTGILKIDRIIRHQFVKGQPRRDVLIADFGSHRLMLILN